jgi:nucleolar protein 14
MRPTTSQGDDLDGNYVLEETEGDGELSNSDAEGSSGEDDEDGDDEDDADAADEDDLRQSFKKQVGSINQRGDLKRGLRRLRRLGILKDGGDAGASSGSDAEDGSDEEDEEDEGEEEEEKDEDGSDEGEEEEDDAGEGSDEPEHAAPAARALHKAPAERLPSREAAVPQSRRAAGELPFTFQAPTTHAEFLRYVDGRSASDLGAVIERICACNAIALAPDNRQKLQVFFGVLLVHFEALAQQVPPPQGHLDVLAHRLLVRHRAWLVVCVAA